MGIENIVLLRKIDYPTEIVSNSIKVYHSLNHELRNIFDKSGEVEKLTLEYNKGCRFLEKLLKRCNETAMFERLKEEDGLYAMRFKGKHNLRILFMFVNVKNCDKAILLNCFSEKSKADYRNGIKVANERRSIIGEEMSKGVSIW